MEGQATIPPRQKNARHDTFATRLRIGFNGLRERWASAPAEVREGKLRICGHPVMEAWEDDYMRVLAEIAGGQGGRVLEIGYGLGISAGHLQDQPIDEHVIIEANEEICAGAERFAASARRPVRVLRGFWEEIAPGLAAESFDGILFDTYPLSPEDLHRNHFPFFREAWRLLRPSGVLTYYSDEASGYSQEHRARLCEAGFTRISGRVCRLNTPGDCAYWAAQTMLAPIVRKAL